MSRIRLTESQLHNVIRKCINEAINELDPRTYANYAAGRQAQGQNEKARQGREAAVNAWNKQYGNEDWKPEPEHIRYSMPEWIYTSWKKQYGNENTTSNNKGISSTYTGMKGDSYTIHDNNSDTNFDGSHQIVTRQFNPSDNTVNYQRHKANSYGDVTLDDEGTIQSSSYDKGRQVARQMATGTGKYVKGKGWQ